MTSVLITGCDRGIGLELVRCFASHSNPPKLLIASCLNPESAHGLQKLSEQYGSIKILQLDVNDINNFENITSEISSLVGDDGLNTLIHNAAIYSDKKKEDLTWEDYQKNFHTNCIAPIFLNRALLPLIRKAAAANSTKPMGINRAAIINVSSAMGSVSLNKTGGYHAYRESKAALHQSARTLAIELGPEGILVTGVHPGWVKTDMGGPDAPLTVEESTAALINVIYSLNESHHDTLVTHSGNKIPL